MTRYWAPYAQLPTTVASNVLINVDGAMITAVRAGADRGDADVAFDGLVYPGFANAHSHAFHRALRGRTHGEGGTFWTWRQQMYAMASRLDPDSYFRLARAVYAEMVLAGMTAVGEFHYLHHDHDGGPYAEPNAISAALVAAARDAGIRLTLLDVCYLHGGLTADGPRPLDPVQRRFADASVDAWAERVADFAARHATDRVRIGAAAHSVRALTPAELERLATVRPAGPVHVHLSEQPAENEAVQDCYGCTPTELLDRAGLLGPDLTAVHATHLTAADIALLGGTGSGTCLCPTTEQDLADGIGPARALADAGSPLSLGSDQHVVVDMFSEIRGLEMHERLSTHQRGRFSPTELITTATAGGYDSLGWGGGGRLAVGAPADLVVVDRSSVRTAGALPGQLHYAAAAADVTDVIIAGDHVVRDRIHRLGEVGSMITEIMTELEKR